MPGNCCFPVSMAFTLHPVAFAAAIRPHFLSYSPTWHVASSQAASLIDNACFPLFNGFVLPSHRMGLHGNVQEWGQAWDQAWEKGVLKALRVGLGGMGDFEGGPLDHQTDRTLSSSKHASALGVLGNEMLDN